VVALHGCWSAPRRSDQPPSTPAAHRCRSIDTEPDWLTIRALAGKPLPDDTPLCRGRTLCCEVARRLVTSPPSGRRVVVLHLGAREEGVCRTENAITEYWLIESGLNGVAASVQLLVVAHHTVYAPEHGEVEGTDTFVWTVDDTCYGHGPGCVPRGRAQRVAFMPRPHVVGPPMDEPICPESMPLLVSGDY
jgi:hypothetical protein